MRVLENDQIKHREDVFIDVEDRGYQFGDGVYEVIRIYDGKPFLLAEHLARLVRSAAEIRLDLAQSPDSLEDLILQLIEAEHCRTGNLYLQVTRGVAPRTHPFPAAPRPVLTGYVMPASRPVDKLREGVKVIPTEDIRWLRCDIKSLNLLGSVLAKQEAVEHSCDEAILHRGQTVTEGSSSNFFIVRGQTLVTHPANHLILHGITRATVIDDLAPRLGLTVEETAFPLAAVDQADEAFVTSTTMEVCPVTHLNDLPIGSGTPGPITRKLQQAYEDLIFKR